MGRRLKLVGATVLVWLAVAGLFVLVVGGARTGEGSSGGSLFGPRVALVELEPGVDGLLHISQMSNRSVGTPSEIVNVGDELTLLVIRVDPNERRIGLSLKELAHAVAAPELTEDPSRAGGRRRKGSGGKSREYDYEDEN